MSDQYIEKLNASGADWVRTELRYFNESTIQNQNDTGNQTLRMLTLAKQCGLKVLAIFDEKISPWTGNSNGDYQPITNVDQLKNLIDNALNGYGGLLDAVEMWNEPDMGVNLTKHPLGNQWYMNGSPEHYCEMLQVLYNETQTYNNLHNASVKVVAGSLATLLSNSTSPGFQYGDYFLRKICELNASSYCDYFSIHVYDGYLNRTDLKNSTVVHSAAEAYRIATTIVGDKPVWITELGANGDQNITLRTEAGQEQFMHECLNDMEHRTDCSAIFWYCYYDPNYNDTNPETWHGIVDYQNLTERPDYNTFKNYSAVPGDISGDFKVDLVDLAILQGAYGSTPQTPSRWNPNADIDTNGVVGLSDLVILALHYKQSSQ